MKTTGFRASVLYLLLAVFIAGVAYLIFSIFINGEDWVIKAYNGHIYASDTTVVKGDILDTNNILLSYTDGDSRVYSGNTSVRCALLHTVGDSSGYIGTSVQSTLGSKLVGYNFFTGLNTLPDNEVFSSNDIVLNLDALLCATAYEALDGQNGAVIVTNYETGEVICKVSTPTYDPMNIPSDLLTNEEYEGVFLDNTISSTYTAGSIFKLVVAASALENLENVEDITYNCTGQMTVDGSLVTCLGTHGEIGIEDALACSCNIYFASLALELGTDALQQTAEELGYNKDFSYVDFYSTASTLDLTNASDIELAWAGVGQYNVMSNPMHMVVLMQAIANDGVSKQLKLTESIVFDTSISSDTVLMDSSVANTLKSYMRNNVVSYYGDSFFPDGMEICAKTGTAEIDGEDPNSWIVGFSSNPDTPYAFCVVVENGGSGLNVAGKIAATILAELA